MITFDKELLREAVEDYTKKELAEELKEYCKTISDETIKAWLEKGSTPNCLIMYGIADLLGVEYNSFCRDMTKEEIEEHCESKGISQNELNDLSNRTRITQLENKLKKLEREIRNE